jgi:hypothetical protein
MALVLHRPAFMQAICDDLKREIPAVLSEWDRLIREEPWFSLPPDHWIDRLPDVVVGLVEASLCDPPSIEAHRKEVSAAASHGWHRRQQELPEHLILTEYHLLRQAIWRYIIERFGPSDRSTEAILRIDTVISIATNASMWGYHREEIEGLGRWEEGIERLCSSSPFLRQPR